jgi:hypothetical protein
MAAGATLRHLRQKLRQPSSHLRRHIATIVTEGLRTRLPHDPHLASALDRLRQGRRPAEFDQALRHWMIRHCVDQADEALTRALEGAPPGALPPPQV